MIMKTQSSFIRQREEGETAEGLPGQLTKADFNLLRLVDSATNNMRERSRGLDQLTQIAQLEPGAVQQLVSNARKHKETMAFEQDTRILSFQQSLKKTKDLIDQADEEDLQRVKRVLENTEKIRETYHRVQAIVVQQAQVVDRIDYNLSQGVVHVAKANKELVKLFESYNVTCLKFQLILFATILVLSLLNFWKLVR